MKQLYIHITHCLCIYIYIYIRIYMGYAQLILILRSLKMISFVTNCVNLLMYGSSFDFLDAFGKLMFTLF